MSGTVAIQLGKRQVTAMAQRLRAMPDEALVAAALPALLDLPTVPANTGSGKVEPALEPWDNEKPPLATPGLLLTEQRDGQRLVQVDRARRRVTLPTAATTARAAVAAPYGSVMAERERRLVEYVTAHPGCPMRDIAKHLGCQRVLVSNASAGAQRKGLIHRRGEYHASRYYPGPAKEGT